MIRPLHNADHVVNPDGTLSLRNLTPGARVHVVVVESSEDDATWGAGPVPGSRTYRPDEPRLPWGAMAGSVFKYERPFDPACDPEDWEALRDSD